MADPTSPGEVRMAAHVADVDREEPDTAAAIKERQEGNFRMISAEYGRKGNSDKVRNILRMQVEQGRGTDFPMDASLDAPSDAEVAASNSQGSIRKVDNAMTAKYKGSTDASGKPFGGAPSIQVEGNDEDSTIRRGATALRNLYSENRDTIDQLIRDTTASVEEAQKRHSEAAVAIATAGTEEAKATMLNASVEAAAAGTRERVLQISGLDTRDSENAFASALASRMSIRAEREKLAKTIDARNAVGMFDNPLLWLINKTVLPGELAQHNALAQAENNNINMVETLQRETELQEKIDMGATADIYASRGIALANAQVATASAKAAEIKANSAALGAQRVINIANLRERVMHDKSEELRWNMIFADKRDASQLKEDERKDRADIDRRLSVVGNMIGRDGVNLQSLKGQGKAVQEAWMTRQGTLTLGDTFAESYEFIAKYGDLNAIRMKGAAEFADMQRAFQRTIDQRAVDIQNTWSVKHPDNPNKIPSTELARRQAADELQAEWYGQKDANMLRASQVNPYKVNHDKEAQTFAGNKDNPIYLMSADARKRGQLLDDSIIFEATKQLVGKGILKPQEAASSLAEYYKDAIERNNSDRSLRAMGLDAQINYKIRPKASNFVLDLTNPINIENYLTKELVNDQARATGFTVPEGMNVQQYPSGAGYMLVYPEDKNKKNTPENLGNVVREQRKPTNPAEARGKIGGGVRN